MMSKTAKKNRERMMVHLTDGPTNDTILDDRLLNTASLENSVDAISKSLTKSIENKTPLFNYHPRTQQNYFKYTNLSLFEIHICLTWCLFK